MFVDGMIYSEVRSERITSFIMSILIISGDILYFTLFIKNNLKEISKAEQIEEEKSEKNIGEIIQLILFSIIILMPIWNIPKFINIYNSMIESKILILEVGKTVSYSILGIFLLISLNPLNVKEKLFRNKYK